MKSSVEREARRITNLTLKKVFVASMVTPLGEVRSPARIAASLARLIISTYGVYLLWTALYSGGGDEPPINAKQALTYSIFALLVLRTRLANRWFQRDTVMQHVRSGSIIYWFLRPVSPEAYYLLRGIGDYSFGAMLSLLPAAMFCLFGIILAPSDLLTALAFLISLTMAQALAIQFDAIIDLACFWFTVNTSIAQITRLIVAFFSGGFAPLVLFPYWFQVSGMFLPFSSMLDTPLAIYVGSYGGTGTTFALARQSMWLVALSIATHKLWSRVPTRLEVQGG